MGPGANRASYRLASAVRACGLPANLGVHAQPAPVDSRKPASAAQCFEFGCVIACRLLGVVVVAGSGSIPHGLLPLSGRVGSLLPPLLWLRGFAHRAGYAIAADGQGLLPETPQGFF